MLPSPPAASGSRKSRPVLLVAALAAVGLFGCTPNPSSQSAGPASSSSDGTSSFGAYLAGTAAAAAGDFGVAAHYLERALSDDPQNVELLRETFTVETGEGNIPRSLDLARRLIAVEPDFTVADMVLAVEDIKAGRLDAGDKRLAALPATGLNNLLVPLSRAWIAAGQKNKDAAIEFMKPLSTVSAFQTLYNLHLGLMMDLIGDQQEAQARFDAMFNADSQPPFRVIELVGNYYERHGQADRARQLYNDFQTHNPDNVLLSVAFQRLTSGTIPHASVASLRDGLAEAIFDIAFIVQHERPGDQLALVYNRVALSLKPDFPMGEMLLADILETANREKEAIAIYQQVSPDSPFRWSARLRAAGAEDAAGETDRAVAELQQMSVEAPERADALAELGDILRSHERFAEAAVAYDTAISRLPKIEKRDWPLLFNRAIAFERNHQIPQAVADLEHTLQLQPDEPYVLNYLGYVWVEKGINLPRARQMIEKAVTLKPNDGSIVDSLGWACYQQGQFKDAVRFLERAAELRPHDPTINDHLGDAYWQVGRHAEAHTQWQRALSFDADPPLRAAIAHKLESGATKPKSAEQHL